MQVQLKMTGIDIGDAIATIDRVNIGDTTETKNDKCKYWICHRI